MGPHIGEPNRKGKPGSKGAAVNARKPSSRTLDPDFRWLALASLGGLCRRHTVTRLGPKKAINCNRQTADFSIALTLGNVFFL
jgi:hypothetical protein